MEELGQQGYWNIVCTHTRTRTHTHTHIHRYIWIYVYTYMYTYTCKYVYTYILKKSQTSGEIVSTRWLKYRLHTHIHTHTHIYIGIHEYLCIHTYTYIHIRIHIRIHPKKPTDFWRNCASKVIETQIDFDCNTLPHTDFNTLQNTATHCHTHAVLRGERLNEGGTKNSLSSGGIVPTRWLKYRLHTRTHTTHTHTHIYTVIYKYV